MSVLKFKTQQFEDAKKKLGTAKGKLDDTISKTAEANKYFLLTQTGQWSDAQGDACVQIETDARIFREAMARFESTFGKLASDAKTIEGDRDGFLSELGAGGGKDLVVCNTGANVSGKCTECVGRYDNLNAKASNAEGALAGLRDSGAIQGAISSVKSDVSTQKAKLDAVRGKWDTLKEHASDFESKYSANKDDPQSLRARNFITAKMVESAAKGLEDAYSKGELYQALKGAAGLKKNWLKPVKDALNYFGKPVNALNTTSGNRFFGIVADMIKQDGMGGYLKSLVEDNPFNGSFLTRLAKQVTGFKMFEWKGRKGFLGKLNEETIGSLGKAAEDLRGGFKGLKNASEVADDLTSSGFARFTAVGRLAKGTAKALGVVGDVISFADIFNNSAAEYHNTAGDVYDKTAAAVVEGTKGLAKWGLGKAVGAFVGTCLGGPVGMAVGVGIGAGADWFFGEVAGWFKESGAQKKASNAVAGAMRGAGNFFGGLFGGQSKKNAFAPA